MYMYKCKCTSASTNVHLRDVSHTDVSDTDWLTDWHGQRGNTLQTGSFKTSSNTNDIARRFWLRRWLKSFRVVVVRQKIWTYGQLDLTAARKSEFAKNHGMDGWTSRQKMCFLTTNISSISPPITLQPGPFVRLI